MQKAEYVNGVSAIRAMENSLLTFQDISRLIDTSSDAEFNSIISTRRGNGDNEFTLDDVWSQIEYYVPDSKELKILLYKNDFHNLKAVLKAVLSNRDSSVYFLTPTNLNLETLQRDISKKDYENLPEHIKQTAEDAYDIITKTLDGQLVDSFIDSSALKNMQISAKKTGNKFMQEYADITTAAADIKTAYRCSKMNKQKSFLETAICGSSILDAAQLIQATLSGTERFLSYLETTQYSEASDLLKESPVKFEKWCDDIIMELAKSARLKSFGIEPLAAYYIAAETEIKNLRIIKICRECKTEKKKITERMRELYV